MPRYDENEKFNDERTFEIDDEQSDPIKSLSVHGLKTLHKHFSKVTAATPVNDIIAVNVMNTNPQKWIMMAQDMDITVNDAENILLGKRESERWVKRLACLDTTITEQEYCIDRPQHSPVFQDNPDIKQKTG